MILRELAQAADVPVAYARRALYRLEALEFVCHDAARPQRWLRTAAGVREAAELRMEEQVLTVPERPGLMPPEDDLDRVRMYLEAQRYLRAVLASLLLEDDLQPDARALSDSMDELIDALVTRIVAEGLS